MGYHRQCLSFSLLLLLTTSASAETRYVDASNTHPSPPYTNWSTAAAAIQDAIDAAAAGDQILVTNGLYSAGGRVVFGSMTNRVAVTKPVTVQSVNGAAATIIQGYQAPGTANGRSAIRCVYLADGAVLSGFTVTNGATCAAGDLYQERSGGGVWCASLSAVVSNCILTGNSALDEGGGAYSGTLANCILTRNAALDGGGCFSSALNNCTLLGNSASPYGGGFGGGASAATLTDCTLTGNLAAQGGGADSSTLTNCTLTGNWAWFSGGGTYRGKLASSILTGNSASTYGGGAHFSDLANCAVMGNSAPDGGGVEYSTLTNCTLTGNSASFSGGGADDSTLNNCIIYFNTALMDPLGANYSGGTLNYCCAAPLPASGVGNFAADPELAGPWHLSAGSPCRGAGNAGFAAGLDVDGEPWTNPPSIGCDEFWAGATTGPLGVSVQAPYTNVAAGFMADFVGNISGNVSASAWDFGDGTVVSNQPYASHSWATAGDYPVVLRAYSDSYPAGVTATILVHVVMQPVHYVTLASVSPVQPYSSWATAATNIQDAVDAAAAGATVLVSNGVYGVGGRVVYGSMTNRLAVTKPVFVRSANGAAVTVIQGRQVPGTTNGNSAIRCAYLTSGAVLEGFTLTGGATRADGDLYQEQSGGGVLCVSWSAAVSNCVISGNSARNGGGTGYGSVANCTLTGNTASAYGGAVYSATLNNCTIATNSASQQGGGAYSGTLVNCTVMGNWAPSGGGTYSSTLVNCTLTGNLATSGGGAYSAALNNCTITGNSASQYGGGSYSSTLANCALTFNSALNGGGTYSDSLTNCTIIGNSAASSGGGAHSSTLNNCIVYFNTAPIDPLGTNYSGGTLNYCCAAPLPAGGLGNLAADPQLAGGWHLSAGSPCRGAGNAGFATGLDLDGEPWTNPPSIGCDEFWAGAATGPLGVSVQAPYTNVAVGSVANFVGNITGDVSASAWDFGDGTVVSNRPYASHAWVTAGDYPVVLRAYNDSYPAGLTATILVRVVMQPVHYVALASVSPAQPYSSWATAATNIQDAVDAAVTAGAMVLVSNGVYGTGGRVVYGSMTNRLAVTRPLIVRSANGAAVTVIQGRQVSDNSAVRCVYLASGAVLEGFTLTNGATRAAGDVYQERSGGGVWCPSLSAVVSNCVIAGNSATKNGGGACYGTVVNCTLTGNSALSYGGAAYFGTVNKCALTGNSASHAGGAYSSTLNYSILTSNFATGMYSGGGGAAGGTLNNCVLAGNSAPYGGGGAASATLNNCTVAGNSASQYGGGTYYSTLNNCIVYNNKAPSGSNYFAGTCSYCCTMPSPGTGPGNFTNAPLLVDPAGGNFRLQPDSPCINAGRNANAPPGLDLDGNPRIAGGTVDVGAFEFQSPASAISYAWLQQYGLPTDGSADFTDPDGDGMNNWQEWRCGTVPTNTASVFRFTSISNDSSGVMLTWSSTFDMYYCVERATNLAGPLAFSSLATNLWSDADTRSYTDSAATNGGAFFYRVRLQD